MEMMSEDKRIEEKVNCLQQDHTHGLPEECDAIFKTFVQQHEGVCFTEADDQEDDGEDEDKASRRRAEVMIKLHFLTKLNWVTCIGSTSRCQLQAIGYWLHVRCRFQLISYLTWFDRLYIVHWTLNNLCAFRLFGGWVTTSQTQSYEQIERRLLFMAIAF